MSHPRVTEATREEVLYDAHWQCQFPGCYRSATEIAHCIAKTEANASMVRRMWREMTGQDMTPRWAWDNLINNPLNMVASCAAHNDYFNCGNNKGRSRKILESIRDDMKKRGGER